MSLPLTNQALHHEGVWGSGCIDPRFLHPGASWRWVVSFTPRPIYLRRKSPLYPLYRRLGGSRNRSGRRGEENIQVFTCFQMNVVCVLYPWLTSYFSVIIAYYGKRHFVGVINGTEVLEEPGFGSRQNQDFYLLHGVHTGSGAHSACYTMATGSKEAGALSWPLTSIESRGQERPKLYLHSPCAFMASCLIN
jgi:hypothetical protein